MNYKDLDSLIKEYKTNIEICNTLEKELYELKEAKNKNKDIDRKLTIAIATYVSVIGDIIRIKKQYDITRERYFNNMNETESINFNFIYPEDLNAIYNFDKRKLALFPVFSLEENKQQLIKTNIKVLYQELIRQIEDKNIEDIVDLLEEISEVTKEYYELSTLTKYEALTLFLNYDIDNLYYISEEDFGQISNESKKLELLEKLFLYNFVLSYKQENNETINECFDDLFKMDVNALKNQDIEELQQDLLNYARRYFLRDETLENINNYLDNFMELFKYKVIVLNKNTRRGRR